MHVLARRDGTDLRTGSEALVVGARVALPAHAPVRLIESSTMAITLGAIDDPGGDCAPWRTFEVKASRRRHRWW